MAGAVCCICKQTIEFEIDDEGTAARCTGFDPCVLVFVTNAYGPREHQREQEFPCHSECFRKMINDDSLMYILEADYPNIGECEREQAEAPDALEGAGERDR
jgi:hypothetical protein